MRVLIGIVLYLGISLADAKSDFEKGLKAMEDQEYQKAMKFFQKACKARETRRCNNLGAMYENGVGVKQNKTKAKDYYGKACDMKENKGCENYARLNEQGY